MSVGRSMNSGTGLLRGLLLVIVLSVNCACAQKVKVGYDKAADFSKYKSYSLQLPAAETSRPLLFASAACGQEGIEYGNKKNVSIQFCLISQS